MDFMSLDKIIQNFEDILTQLKKLALISNDQKIENISEIEKKSDFDVLKSLLMSEEWPQAAPDFLICEENEQDKIDRAEGIISYLSQDLRDKSFLDFGCGEGHVALNASTSGATKSHGYDILKSGNLNWEEKKESFLLTSDFEKIKKNAPYDFVLLYDVLDHTENPVEVLNKIRQIVDDNSKIFVRCHPFSSRHGTHLYRKLNKAYVQLVFTDEELTELGLIGDIKQKTYFPINENNKWFDGARFKVVSQDGVKTLVEDFFKDNKLVSSRITRDDYSKAFPEHQMAQVFNDYVLQILP
jgi:2-polyprenyl-3-methyl-5-hydroxy-6-metoxy-1,4-benzoquinol methylase